jgi:HAD superfamily phosphatase
MTFTSTPHAEQTRPEIDAVIFDMDGVLLDISGSIRVVNCLAVPFYLRTVLGWPAPDTMLTSADIELFKNAGGFNDDWDLSYALVLHYLVKGHEYPDVTLETLNILPPSLRRFTAKIKEHGGWLSAAESMLLDGLSRDDREAIVGHYDKGKIKRIFQELMGGEHCQRLYGFAPTLYHGPGWINKDRVLLDPTRVPDDKKLGVQTGRTRPEAELGMEFTGLDKRIAPEFVVTKDDGFQKPEPDGLLKLAKRMGFRQAIYIGDTLDDLRTVRNFNTQSREVKFLAAQVLTGPAGNANLSLFRNAGADLIAPDVNAVLDWLAGERVQ